jgi:hypothetical protein
MGICLDILWGIYRDIAGMLSMMSWDFVWIYDIYIINCIKCFCLMGFDADVTRILLDVLYVFFGDMIETADQFMSKTFSEQ